MRTLIALLTAMLIAGCAHYNYRPNFKVEDYDFYALAKVGLDKIDPDGRISTVAVPSGLDPRIRSAYERLKHLKRLTGVISASEIPQSPGYKLPPGYFRLEEFTIQNRIAEIKGQVGPVTRKMTGANMPDCGRIYTIIFTIESDDWVSHAYKVEQCDKSRHWTPVGSPTATR